MKKFLVILCLFMMQCVFADTMPFYVNSIPKTAIGMYQTDNCINIYKNPDVNSKEVAQFNFSYNPETMPDEVFAFLINEKHLGFLYVTDFDEDGWVEVIYNKKRGLKGWVKSNDNFQFLSWINFYNMYGRKYGLRLFKDAPDETKILHAKSDDLSQNLSKLNHIQKIKLVKVQGNWALVSVVDIDKVAKTGWMKWRNSDGVIYAFPDIK